MSVGNISPVATGAHVDLLASGNDVALLAVFPVGVPAGVGEPWGGGPVGAGLAAAVSEGAVVGKGGSGVADLLPHAARSIAITDKNRLRFISLPVFHLVPNNHKLRAPRCSQLVLL